MKLNKQQLDVINRAFFLAINEKVKATKVSLAKQNEGKIAKAVKELGKIDEARSVRDTLYRTANANIQRDYDKVRTVLNQEFDARMAALRKDYDEKQAEARRVFDKDYHDNLKQREEVVNTIHTMQGENLRPDHDKVWNKLEMQLVFAEDVTDVTTIINRAVNEALKESM